MCHFEPCHALCTDSLKAPQSTITNPGAPIPPLTPLSPPPPLANQHVPEPCNRWLQGSPGVSWGWGGGWLRLGRGTGVFGIVVTWPDCLSVCRWMSSMWPCGPRAPPPTLYSPKVRALIAGQEARDGGIQWSSRTIPPKISVLGLLSTPSHLLWKSAVLSRGGGEWPKQTQGTRRDWWTWAARNHD